jgi:ferredoxin
VEQGDGPARPAGVRGRPGEATAVREAWWQVAVDHGRCVGSGVCVGTAPGRFRLAVGRSRPVEGRIEPDPMVLDAAELCPTEAITVRDAAGRPVAPRR